MAQIGSHAPAPRGGLEQQNMAQQCVFGSLPSRLLRGVSFEQALGRVRTIDV
ncbi:hypothetical protein [Mycolicibacterium sp. YH-1]|uniref:hypothetical protein n=1 Tax=Mycolicibacterium sp. YH-1 TaxID=2908837 RepID=UPI001F4C1061|nr:hypothetical protein [Mycolicibacterium sp. YH-1]UNB50096.1 hypothetical protein L0M16_19065 [Mycolicibacterium sp. YH-1]